MADNMLNIPKTNTLRVLKSYLHPKNLLKGIFSAGVVGVPAVSYVVV